MKNSAYTIAFSALLVLAPQMSRAAGVVDLAKAQSIISSIASIADKYRDTSIELKAPTPLANSSGSFVLPYAADGTLTEWATKSLTAEMGGAVGEGVGQVAGNELAKKLPFGGSLLTGVVAGKGRELGAITAIGGWAFIKKSSALSFNTLDEYAVYMQVTHGKDANYQQALAAATAIYPKLGKDFDGSINKAYKEAAKAAKKAEKASP